jgi:hypothetical protein
MSGEALKIGSMQSASPMGFLCQILGQPANEKSFLLLPVGFPGKTPRFPTSRRSILSESAIFLE